ncbi:hypothetical protein PIB30_068760 [Stylosanthes scabra]|uniref:Uncharacterized protein n=1 Tax=Stylosanthes scabra TaxID=79078 RepID=A0ABU6WQZ7_9FABA|nr:hypothetical protein [Stylosanthes scabra]
MRVEEVATNTGTDSKWRSETADDGGDGGGCNKGRERGDGAGQREARRCRRRYHPREWGSWRREGSRVVSVPKREKRDGEREMVLPPPQLRVAAVLRRGFTVAVNEGGSAKGLAAVTMIRGERDVEREKDPSLKRGSTVGVLPSSLDSPELMEEMASEEPRR